ncbi:MAG: hypothetical protein GMKNLPBB_00451 [Myxococcota bacterium]|nr:hypothetical protein [Myxococcota bacterium]
MNRAVIAAPAIGLLFGMLGLTACGDPRTDPVTCDSMIEQCQEAGDDLCVERLKTASALSAPARLCEQVAHRECPCAR